MSKTPETRDSADPPLPPHPDLTLDEAARGKGPRSIHDVPDLDQVFRPDGFKLWLGAGAALIVVLLLAALMAFRWGWV